MAKIYDDTGGARAPHGGRLGPEEFNIPVDAPPDPDAGAAGNGHHPSPAEAFAQVGERFQEIKAYATYFLSAKADGVKSSLRNVALYAVLGVLGLIIGGALLVTAAVQLLTGLAGAIGAIFDPDMPWVGHLVVGLLVLGGTGVAAWLMLRKLTKGSRERTVRKYEQLQRRQRDQYGHTVHERAVRAHEAAAE
jgi:hypothetical protein